MSSWREEDILTGFLFLCVICHGMFFVREWVVLGTILIVYRTIKYIKKNKLRGVSVDMAKVTGPGYITRDNWIEKTKLLFNPISVFVSIIVLSLSGLFNPIRAVEGWLEAYKWLIFLSAYLWGKELAHNIEIRDKIITRIIGIALISIVITLLPYSDLIWSTPVPPESGRFASCFGYPNALAVFIGSVLLLLLRNKTVDYFYLAFFTLCLISTGSRAGVVILLFFYTVLIIKRIVLNFKDKQTTKSDIQLGFYKGVAWKGIFNGERPLITKIILGILMIFILQHTLWRFQISVEHLADWTGTSLPERFNYYLDSLKISWRAHFLPQAGGWLAFPFIQSIPYWTLDPHSSLCRILLNQGLAGVLVIGVWSVQGIAGYIKDLIWSNDLRSLCTKTTAFYLGLHSLIDVDMSFGSLGILFWLMIGMSSKTS